MLVAPEVAVAAMVTVAAVDAAKVVVALFLPCLNGTLGALVASMTAVFFWFFLPPADMEVADEAGALFLAAHVGREFFPEVESAI